MIRALTIYKLPVRIKALTAKAVEALIFTEVNIAIIIYTVQNVFYRFLMLRVRSANKITVLNIQLGPESPEKTADTINIALRRLTCIFSCRYNLVSMLIRSGKEICFLPHKHMKPVHNIGHNGGVGMADVWLGVHIINRCGYIKSSGQGSIGYSSFSS